MGVASPSGLIKFTQSSFLTHNPKTKLTSSLKPHERRKQTKEYKQVQEMESPDFSPPHVDASRPSLGFPLGTALLLIIIFTLSGIFSCCYHWDKLRSLRRSFSPDGSDPNSSDLEHGPTKPNSSNSVIFSQFWAF